MKPILSSSEQLVAERLAQRLGLAASPARLGAVPAGAQQAMQRRVFLKLGGIGGLALGWACASDDPVKPSMDPGAPMGTPGPDAMMPAPGPAPATPAAPEIPANQYDLSAYVRIADDESVTLYIGQSDMGQGVLTAIPMIIAEELDVDWANVRSEHPIASQQKYGMQFTAGSASVANSFSAMRQMGAAAREMLMAAAASRWQVPASQLRTNLGVVFHDATERRATYGELAELAATLPAPQNPRLKSESDFKIIGTPRAQLSARLKAEGKAQYTIDVQVEGMLIGLVARSPGIGGTLVSFDDTAARQVPGVREVVRIPSGVAVLADHFWAALKGRDALVVQWNDGPNAGISTSALQSSMMAQMGQGQNRTNVGNPEQVIAAASSARKLNAVYQLPYLAHAPMEPLNAVADVRPDRVEVWAGTQGPTSVLRDVATATGVAPANITLHVPYLGGGFGRRLVNDYVLDAVNASRAVGRPVKLLHTREDDMRSAQYRPINANRMQGSLDADGWPNAWIHEIVVPGLLGGIFATEGAATNYPYAMPNRRVTWQDPAINVPVWTWRSVGASHNAFVVESFVDELAALGDKDPLEVRLRLLGQSSDANAARHAAALQDVATRSGWNTPAPAGRARGIACHQTFGTIAAEVAEVSVDSATGQVTVHKVWATVDCGRAINPRGVEAQVQSGIIFGLTAALYGKIDIENGRPTQGNFDTYRLMRINEAPEMEVNIINSGAAITGMGEPGVPPIAPAVCNAIFRLTGQRIRTLPIQIET
ncbi:MAG: xanthine dehydrogenase family protein molybdopterin-binding subunit [Deltaproteobacteria bacterium]